MNDMEILLRNVVVDALEKLEKTGVGRGSYIDGNSVAYSLNGENYVINISKEMQ